MSARAMVEVMGEIIATAIMVANASKNRRMLSPHLFLE
jgi:hypothetical protein